MTAFWDIAVCSLVHADRRFRLTYYPDDRGSKDSLKVSQLLGDYMAQNPKRLPSSYSPPSEPEISLSL
jgi:hypothetical protein